MEELIEELKKRYDGANAAMQQLEHKAYHRGRQEGKASAYEHCIRSLEKLKNNVVLGDVSNCYQCGGKEMEVVRLCNDCGATEEIKK